MIFCLKQVVLMLDKKSKKGYDKDKIIEEVPFEELTLDEYLEISSFEDEVE